MGAVPIGFEQGEAERIELREEHAAGQTALVSGLPEAASILTDLESIRGANQNWHKPCHRRSLDPPDNARLSPAISSARTGPLTRSKLQVPTSGQLSVLRRPGLIEKFIDD
jgi:hypothetical protein